MKSTALALVICFCGAVHATPEVPPEFMGDWVPQTSSCRSQLRFRVEAQSVVLINRSQSKSFGDLDFCYTCEGGAKYSGQVVWFTPEFDGRAQSPFTAKFNAGEKLGVVLIDIQTVELKKQFPLHQIALKRCAKKVKTSTR